MKTPPLLLGAVLLFWGWQSDLLWMGAVMGLILEGARLVHIRWEFSETDFRRTAMFCTLLSLALAIYAFTTSDEGDTFGGLFHNLGSSHNVAVTTIHTATSWLRWLPIILYLFVVAQIYSTREAVPLTMFSMYWRWRVRQEKKEGRDLAVPSISVSYPYFIICLFSASIHVNDGTNLYFWGGAVLIGWALWPFRSLRYGIIIWVAALALAIIASFWGQIGIGLLQRDVERYDMRWMMRFLRPSTESQEAFTAIGQIGNLELSDSIVIRLKTQNNEPPPAYLREASYRLYYSKTRGSGWLAGAKGNSSQPVDSLANQLTWMLPPGKTGPRSVNIACYLNGRSPDGNPQGLLPLPTGCGELNNFNAYLLRENLLGDVNCEGPGLVIFDALYGPGATIDSAPDLHWDTFVPTNETPALHEVIREMNLSTNDEQKTLDTVSEFFQRNFKYSTWQGADKLATSNETSLAKFLLHSRTGHCEYFATATVLLLRELNIPARYAVGYYVSEPSHGGYVVRERDAHAWCLVWNDKRKTWEDFDTTPSSWVGIENQRMSSLQGFWDFWSWVRFQIAKFRWGQGNIRDYMLWALIPILAGLMAQIIFSRRKRQKTQSGKMEATFFWPGLDSEFYMLERKLAERGTARPTNEPLSDWLVRALENPALYDLREPLNELLRLHYRYRFDPRGLDNSERKLLSRKVKECLEALSRSENVGAKV